jgi:MoxR-like ATPase
MNKSDFNAHVAAAAAMPGVVTGPIEQIYLPFADIQTREVSLCAAFVTRVSDERDASNVSEHTVVISYQMANGEASPSIWCADKFLEGNNLSPAEADVRVDQALAMCPSNGKNALKEAMLKSYAKYSTSGACQFWKDMRRSGTLCAHTATALAHLREANPSFMDVLVQAYDSALEGGAAADEDVKGEILSLAEMAFQTPVLIEGDRGSGKTTAVRQFARQGNLAYIEMGGHEGIEAPDLLGYLVPLSASQMVWKDGPLAEAFRKARTQKVVLLLDEILRIPSRELSILLTALSPDEGVYRLRTGRVLTIDEGVATEETLECPVGNLFVVATTNVGAEYSVDEIDPAVAERFMPLRKDTELAELKLILDAEVKKKGLPKKVSKGCSDFFVKMKDAQFKGLVHRTPTTRTLVRAILLSGGQAESVKRALLTQALLWVARNADGQPVPEQVKTVRDLLDVCFKAV